MPLWKVYTLAKTITDTLNALAAAPGPARLVAGGTDLLLDLQQGRHPPVHTLVDVTGVEELNALQIRGDRLFIGAAVPLNCLVQSPLVAQHAQAVQEACALIAGPQVRNSATLGGNVAHALPAADGSIALLAMDATAEIAGLGGVRLIPLEQLFLGPGRSALDPIHDLLVGFYLPLSKKGSGSAFRRIMRPQGVALPVLNLAVSLERKGDTFRDVHIAVGPAGPIPMRARQAELVLRGQAFTPEAMEFAKAALLAELHFRTSPQRASREYRRHLVTHLLEDTLTAAWERSRVAGYTGN